MKFNRKTKVLLYGANLWYFGEGLLGPLFAVFAERIGGNILDISFAWATYLIFAGVLYMGIGKITDIYKNKEKIMVYGYALNALCTLSYVLVSAPWHLLIVQAGLGTALAMATPTWNALYAKHQNKKQDGSQWGIAGGTAQITIGIAIIIGGYIVNYLSFTTLFITMGTIQIIATLYQAQILRKTKKRFK